MLPVCCGSPVGPCFLWSIYFCLNTRFFVLLPLGWRPRFFCAWHPSGSGHPQYKVFSPPTPLLSPWPHGLVFYCTFLGAPPRWEKRFYLNTQPPLWSRRFLLSEGAPPLPIFPCFRLISDPRSCLFGEVPFFPFTCFLVYRPLSTLLLKPEKTALDAFLVGSLGWFDLDYSLFLRSLFFFFVCCWEEG